MIKEKPTPKETPKKPKVQTAEGWKRDMQKKQKKSKQ